MYRVLKQTTCLAGNRLAVTHVSQTPQGNASPNDAVSTSRRGRVFLLCSDSHLLSKTCVLHLPPPPPGPVHLGLPSNAKNKETKE